MLVPNWSLLDCDLLQGPEVATDGWNDLAGRSLAPSGYNRPELMATAFRHWPDGRLATVRDQDGMRLALPVRRRRFPLAGFENWSSPLNFHGMPHVDCDAAEPALACLLRGLDAPLLLRSVPVGGRLWEALVAASGRMTILNRWERAVLRPAGTYEQWFDANFERKRRKEYRRLQARLEEQGHCRLVSLTAAADVPRWVEDFLALEASGWKGRRGTSMVASATTAAALRDACIVLAASGRLRFWKVDLDGRPVAMLFAIVDGEEAWLGKIAHDESFARFSPGTLVTLYATEQCFRDGLKQVDSCAVPDHPMINRLWRDRLHVADVMVASTDMPALAFTLTATSERLRRTARQSAKSLYHAITGQRSS